jgi:REP-associated tyrosine transposase
MSSYTHLYVHVVFSTKDRTSIIRAKFSDRLYRYIHGIVAAKKGVLAACGGMGDHIHLLVSLPPSKSVSEMVRDIKANSSHWIHEFDARYRTFSWQEGYSAFGVSASMVEPVKKYIAGQKEHHRKVSFQEEWTALMKKHGIEIVSPTRGSE